jgi:hypothetical protein
MSGVRVFPELAGKYPPDVIARYAKLLSDIKNGSPTFQRADLVNLFRREFCALRKPRVLIPLDLVLGIGLPR